MWPSSEHTAAARPPSPWSGSQYEIQHRWQLDGVRSLSDAAEEFRALADELVAAHAAGWWLREPMRNGHVHAARLSRRQRAHPCPAAVPPAEPATIALRWRLRVVEEPPLPGDAVLHVDAPGAGRTPVLASTDRSLRQVSGPAISVDLLAELRRQLLPIGTGPRLWGLAPARVGPSADLVADGSALRVHALHEGALVRTVESLAFQHAADGAETLLAAAAAYRLLARAAEAMVAAGGRLACIDNGRLEIAYEHR